MNLVRVFTSASLLARVWLGMSTLGGLPPVTASAGAQGPAGPQIECVRPARDERGCRVQLATADGRETLIVRVLDASGRPRNGVTVSFATEGVPGSLTADEVTGQNGVATAEWARPRASDSTVIYATAMVDGARVLARLTILPRPANPPTPWELGKPLNDRRAWYVERQLQAPTRVEIVGPDSTQCAGVRVRFRAVTEGSGAAPDTASGLYTRALGCYAETRWRLGKEVGEQVLQAHLVGEPAKRAQFTAHARGLPRLMAGVALSRVSRYDRLKDSSRTVRVTRTSGVGTPNTDQTAFDSVVAIRSSERSDYFQATPIIGIDWAPHLGWQRLRTFVGVSPTNARREWVVGLSGLQFAFKGQRESVPFDVQAVLHFQRRDVVTNPAVCGRGNPLGACTTEPNDARKPVGFGAVLSFDSFAVLSQILSAFPLR